MNTIRTAFTSSNVDPAHELSQGIAQDPQGSLAAFMIQYQRLLNKEAREDHQLRRQEERAQQLQSQEQAQPAPGFFQSIGNFLTGSDSGTGDVQTGSGLAVKAQQPEAEWNHWKFLNLR